MHGISLNVHHTDQLLSKIVDYEDYIVDAVAVFYEVRCILQKLMKKELY
jgi:hypothetical protein